MQNTPAMQQLRIAPEELEMLLAELDRDDEARPPSSKRKRRRWKLRGSKMIVSIPGPNGTAIHFIAAPRNISSEGLAALVSSFIHTGSKCVVTIKDLAGTMRNMRATVVHCEHMRGTLHGIGMRLDEPLTVTDFLQLGNEPAFTLEHVDPAQLRGKILFVDGDRSEQKLYAHHAKGSRLELFFAENGADAIAKLRRISPDVVFVTSKLPDVDATEWIRRAIEAGCIAPIMLLAAEAIPDLRQRVLDAGASEMLVKPLTSELLRQAIAEHLLLERDDRGLTGPIFSAVSTECFSLEMISEYLGNLQQTADQLAAALDAGADADAFTKLRAGVVGIKGSALHFGFERLDVLANEALIVLDATKSLEKSAKEIRALVGACRRARPPRQGRPAAPKKTPAEKAPAKKPSIGPGQPGADGRRVGQDRSDEPTPR